jgi:nucleoside-diphosphate-sugar epimerase
LGILARQVDKEKVLKILVIGGCGYTGSVLVSDLLAEGHEVVVFDAQWFGNHLQQHPRLSVHLGDIRTSELPMDDVDWIIHLANVANDPSVDLAPTLSWEVNVLATMRILESAVKSNVKNFVFASSGSVYGVKSEPEVTEDLELLPISVYNKTKMIAERVVLSYQNQIKVWIVRPATVCGLSPRMRLDLSVNMLCFQALSNSKITVFGGDQIRPNIHVDDLSAVYRHIISNRAPAGIYNAGFENLTILSLAEEIRKATGAEIQVSESNDPRSYRQSSKKLLASGFQPTKTVASAITEIVDAYRSGLLVDKEEWHTVKSMISKNLV